MNTYKLGNKITCIIRSYSDINIGDEIIKSNQPYTVVKTANANIQFSDIDKVSKSQFNQMYYNNSKIERVILSDILINDRILNLIFNKSEIKFISAIENYESIDGKIYLNSSKEIHNLFIYNANQELITDYEILDNSIIDVKQDGNFLVCYQYEGNISYNFNRTNNNYFTLDLLVNGNVNDSTQTMNIHIEKCALKINKNMDFTNVINSINLEFIVIDTDKNYITLQ